MFHVFLFSGHSCSEVYGANLDRNFTFGYLALHLNTNALSLSELDVFE